MSHIKSMGGNPGFVSLKHEDDKIIAFERAGCLMITKIYLKLLTNLVFVLFKHKYFEYLSQTANFVSKIF